MAKAIKILDGKRYILHKTNLSKAEATRIAKVKRQKGYYCRVVKENHGVYSVYDHHLR